MFLRNTRVPGAPVEEYCAKLYFSTHTDIHFDEHKSNYTFIRFTQKYFLDPTMRFFSQVQNPLTTTRATIVAQYFFVITLQPLQLDRCSNPLRMRKVFLVLLNKKIFDWGEGFPWSGLAKLGCFRFFDQL